MEAVLHRAGTSDALAIRALVDRYVTEHRPHPGNMLRSPEDAA